ncbi:surface protein amastin, putative [Leishmania tarentolae]|uniref:Surface protein amastin, putative n=1 Tax=Leishmania tarentolae TaxID=5689 RepID=A0A640KMI5_LEITA|nr:surface protein amastin, putative [Leishmania tarentolae]GET90692.1 surface protein amastin, putative [Leishmania tarentolae]
MGFEALRGRMDVALNMLCSCIVFVFLVTSAPISQFRGKGINASATGGASKLTCVTVWGLKNDCDTNNYDYRPTSMGCARAKQLFQVSEAFYIIAVIVSFLSCLMCGLYFIGIKAKVLLIVLAIFEAVFALIPWVCMTSLWYNNYCGGSPVNLNKTNGKLDGVPHGFMLRETFRISAGYGLTVAAWCIQVIGLGLLIAM